MVEHCGIGQQHYVPSFSNWKHLYCNLAHPDEFETRFETLEDFDVSEEEKDEGTITVGWPKEAEATASVGVPKK